MGFRVELGEVYAMVRHYQGQLERVQDSLDEVKSAFNEVIASNAFTGATGQAITDDINNNHATILVGFKNLYVLLLSEYWQTVEEFKACVDEHDEHAIVDEDALGMLKNQLSGFDMAMGEFDRRIVGIYCRIDDIVDLGKPERGYGQASARVRRVLDETVERVHRFASQRRDSETAGLLAALQRRTDLLAELSGVAFSDPRLQRLAADSVLAGLVHDIDGAVAAVVAERQRLQQQEIERWKKEHWLESVLGGVDRWVVGLGGLVGLTRDMPGEGFLGGLRSVLLVVESLVVAVGGVVTGVALAGVGVARLAADGVVFVGSGLVGQRLPGWVQRDLGVAGRFVSEGWSRACAWHVTVGSLSGRDPGVSRADIVAASVVTVGDARAVVEGMAGWDEFDWGRVAGEVGLLFVPVAGVAGAGGKVVATAGRVAGVVGKTSRTAAGASKVRGVVRDGTKPGKANKIDIDKIRLKLETEPDTAFFWSGKTEGIGGADIAATVAKNRGGVTLESIIKDKNVEIPEWNFKDPNSMKAWDVASGVYAEQVSGEVRAVIGSRLREGSIWENIELPRLKNNPDVTRVITIDPKTKSEKVIFDRAMKR